MKKLIFVLLFAITSIPSFSQISIVVDTSSYMQFQIVAPTKFVDSTNYLVTKSFDKREIISDTFEVLVVISEKDVSFASLFAYDLYKIVEHKVHSSDYDHFYGFKQDKNVNYFNKDWGVFDISKYNVWNEKVTKDFRVKKIKYE